MLWSGRQRRSNLQGPRRSRSHRTRHYADRGKHQRRSRETAAWGDIARSESGTQTQDPEIHTNHGIPKVIAIHLSRSVFEPNSYSTKNQAKVSYTQRLRLGGILNEKWYKLLGIVCHKGGHNSGHYESFRRNHVYPPFATPDAFSAYAARSRPATPAALMTPSPHISALGISDETSGTDPSSLHFHPSHPRAELLRHRRTRPTAQSCL